MAPSFSKWRMHAELALEIAPEPPQQSGGGVCLEAMPETLALLRLGKGVPDCVRAASRDNQFTAVVQEPAAATALVPRNLLPRPAELANRDGAEECKPGVGWSALCIGRPGSGRNGLKLPAAAGQAGELCALLADASVSAKVLSATGTEVLLIPEESLPAAAATFVSHGHAIWSSTRVCDQRPWETARDALSDPSLMQQQAGAWGLVQREEPLGTIVEEYTEGDGPLRLQAPSGLFIELRVPETDTGGEHKQASFGGRCRTVKQDGQVVCTQLRAIDFQPPEVYAPRSQMTLGTSSIEAVGHPHGEYRELWARLSDETDVVALELQSEVPEPKNPRCGVWLFTGKRFARLVGLPRGSGLVASTCCKSLGQLQRLRGYAEVRYELREHYEALGGVVEEPGLLRIRRKAWSPKEAGSVFYSAADESTGEIVVGQDCIVRILPGGRRETWRIVEWTFDPFTPSSSGAASEASSPCGLEDDVAPRLNSLTPAGLDRACSDASVVPSNGSLSEPARSRPRRRARLSAKAPSSSGLLRSLSGLRSKSRQRKRRKRAARDGSGSHGEVSRPREKKKKKKAKSRRADRVASPVRSEKLSDVGPSSHGSLQRPPSARSEQAPSEARDKAVREEERRRARSRSRERKRKRVAVESRPLAVASPSLRRRSLSRRHRAQSPGRDARDNGPKVSTNPRRQLRPLHTDRQVVQHVSRDPRSTVRMT